MSSENFAIKKKEKLLIKVSNVSTHKKIVGIFLLTSCFRYTDVPVPILEIRNFFFPSKIKVFLAFQNHFNVYVVSQRI